VAPPGRAGPRARRRPDARRGRRAGLGAGPQRQRRRPALARPPSLHGGRPARSRSHGCSSCWPTSTRCGEPPRRRTSACRSARRATGWRPIPRARDGRRTRCAARR
jgi:hypothetical protein